MGLMGIPYRDVPLLIQNRAGENQYYQLEPPTRFQYKMNLKDEERSFLDS
jgi:hypothetical protein